jgi:hypothetical protein
MGKGTDTIIQDTPIARAAPTQAAVKSRNRSLSQETKVTVPEDDVTTSESTSEHDDRDSERGEEELSDDEFDGDAGISSKSLTSHASSNRPKSLSSVVSQRSCSSSSTSKDELAPSAEDIRRIREQLQKSLQEENTLLAMQQQLLGELEGIEHAMIKAKMEERISLVASQQAHIMGLLTREEIAL